MFRSSTMKSAAMPGARTPAPGSRRAARAPLRVKMRTAAGRSIACSGQSGGPESVYGSRRVTSASRPGHGFGSGTTDGQSEPKVTSAPASTSERVGQKCIARSSPTVFAITSTSGVRYQRIGHISATTSSALKRGRSSGWTSSACATS